MNSVQITRESILEYLRQPDFQPGKMKELAHRMGVRQSGYRDFRRLVKDLETRGLIIRLRQNRYGLARDSARVVGRLRVHPRGFGFVLAEGLEADLFIPQGALGTAIDGDLVRAEVTGEAEGDRGPEGRVVEIVRKTARSLIGTLVRRGRRVAVDADAPGLGRDIFIEGDLPEGAQEGHRVSVTITERGWGYDGLRGQIQEVLGAPDDAALDFLSVVRRYDLAGEYSVPGGASQQPQTPDMAAELGVRTDLRDTPCVTIDPIMARDFDDAVSLERAVDGGYRLGVHIADVSHFVQPGTALDRAAFERGASVYLLDHVLHMLPADLAADLCSLRPQVDRLAVSVLIGLDRRGEVTGFELLESVVRSAARLDYEQAQRLLQGNERAAAVADQTELLLLMGELSRKRQEIRRRRGALDLDVVEPRVDLDGHGNPCGLGRYARLESHRLIEEFMLVANECVGQYAACRRLPVLYRVHAPPDAEKLRHLSDIVPGPAVSVDRTTPKQLQQWLQTIASRADAPVLNKLLLQAMMRAVYAEKDGGHFGLACRRYLHFTSPIRRYPDLLVHRVLKASIRGELDTAYRDGLVAQLGWIARWTTQCEQRAEQAERTYRTIKQLRYMAQLIGEEFAGTVSGVLRGGFFVELDEFATQGFCFLRGLDDYYEFEPHRQRLVGRRTRQTIQVGASLRVRIAAVDWNAQEMDLELVGELSGRQGQRRQRRKAPGRGPRRRRTRS